MCTSWRSVSSSVFVAKVSLGSSRPSVVTAPAPAELPCGARSPSPRPFVAAAPSLAEPQGGARSRPRVAGTPEARATNELSSSNRVAATPASAEPAALNVVPVAGLGPHRDFETGRWLVTAWVCLAFKLVSRI